MIPQRHAHSKIGLLGGSFNPAHDGHREISLAAIRWLGLDAVWWLVSPGNPLKDLGHYAPYEQRLARARAVADHPAIVISNFEERKGLRYTVDTLDVVTAIWPDARFVWLMGADSLEGVHEWKEWRRIFATVPIAVFNRPGHEKAAAESVAAKEFAAFRLDGAQAARLACAEPPVWAFFPDTANTQSATRLRAQKKIRERRAD